MVCVWCVYDVCMGLYVLCMVCVRYLSDVYIILCMICVWFVYDCCTCVYYLSKVCVGYVYDVCMFCWYDVYILCMMFTCVCMTCEWRV